MARTDAQKRATNKWRAEKMHRVALDFTLSDYDRVKTAADAAGVPVGTFCRSAIWAAVGDGAGMDPEEKSEK